MAKVTAPFLSLEAKGQFAHVLTYRNRKNFSDVKMYKKNQKPPTSNTAKQLYRRDLHARYVKVWQSISETSRQFFNEGTKTKNHSGFNEYIKRMYYTKQTHLGTTSIGDNNIGNLTLLEF